MELLRFSRPHCESQRVRVRFGCVGPKIDKKESHYSVARIFRGENQDNELWPLLSTVLIFLWMVSHSQAEH